MNRKTIRKKSSKKNIRLIISQQRSCTVFMERRTDRIFKHKKKITDLRRIRNTEVLDRLQNRRTPELCPNVQERFHLQQRIHGPPVSSKKQKHWVEGSKHIVGS